MCAGHRPKAMRFPSEVNSKHGPLKTKGPGTRKFIPTKRLVHSPHNRSTLNEQFNANVKEFGQFSCLCFANGAFAVKHFRGDAFRPKNLPEVFLCQVTCLH